MQLPLSFLLMGKSMSNHTIMVEALRGPCALRSFIQFPFSLFRDIPYWVPALWMDDLNIFRTDKNTAYAFSEAKFWMAYQDGKPVGRIAGIINHRHIEKWGQPYACFGWFDFIDDRNGSAALIKTVEDWVSEQGLKAVHGPLGFTDLDREGMLVEGFEEMSTLETHYNFAYYQDHLRAAGYQKDTNWVE